MKVNQCIKMLLIRYPVTAITLEASKHQGKIIMTYEISVGDGASRSVRHQKAPKFVQADLKNKNNIHQMITAHTNKSNNLIRQVISREITC